MSEFESFDVSHIPWAENAWAGALSWLAMLIVDSLEKIYVEHLKGPTIDGNAKVYQMEHELS